MKNSLHLNNCNLFTAKKYTTSIYRQIFDVKLKFVFAV